MSTADLFVEAVDTLAVLLQSARIWFVLMAVVAGIVCAAVLVVARAVLYGVWRAVRAVWARVRSCAPVSRPESPSRLPRAVRGAPGPSMARTERPVPSWARTEPHRYDNAA